MQMTHLLLCVGLWSLQKLVKTEDVIAVSKMQDEEGDEKEMEGGWDAITVK